ncbi:predicted protein [Streptomyces viridochromogenes DSM 40736]|uniref:Predicted protein n=1 Tax=Streptomyces viridochromogenes (strain DSM 40736 / JCM 4977 / BCRC 1201 / Tue 494) TaxID=591159 RepID=D9XEQ5_STRVT|nr:predicted protein [Streptomyces viridochromogenes DSM 40736]
MGRCAPAAGPAAPTLGRSPVVLPIPGTARTDHLEDSLAAADLQLTPAHRDRLDRLAEEAPAASG